MGAALLSETRWQVAVALELRDAELRPVKGDGTRRREEALSGLSDPAYADALSAPPSLHDGPAVQLLMRRPECLVDLLSPWNEMAHPYRWVVGIGFGPVSLAGDRLLGGAFEEARLALWTARRDRRPAVAKGFGSPEEEVLAALFESMDQLRARWTPRQCETVRAARGASGRDVAAQFGVSPSVVSESLKAAGFRSLQRWENAAAELLARFGTAAPYYGDHVRLPDLLQAIGRPLRRVAVEVG